MDSIYETNSSFDFNNLSLLTPINTPGGNYFIKFRMNESPLYIQSPKCKTKQGILKSNKKYYCDLMFTNENESFINWMESLENYCRKVIFENRSKWFDIELDEHDIENSFTSPLKLYKSGKFYIARTNVPTTMGICSLKIFNSNADEIPLEDIKDNMDVVSILEIQGIKCSTKNFQIEIEMKQMMVIESKNLFEKCIFKGKQEAIDSPITNIKTPLDEIVNHENVEENSDDKNNIEHFVKMNSEEPILTKETLSPLSAPLSAPLVNPEYEMSEITEFDFNLEKLNDTEVMKIKKKNEIYIELYKEAKRKAKIARDLALSSYLESKHIKNTYLFDEFLDDCDSDFDESFEKMI